MVWYGKTRMVWPLAVKTFEDTVLVLTEYMHVSD